MIKNDSNIESILENYEAVIGEDFIAYKNHCYRVFNYMKLMDLTEREEEQCSVMLPFHDLGIWTNKTMDYLPSSIQLAINYIQNKNLDIEENLIENFIGNHHRVFKNKGTLEEKIRKADLIDLSFGIIRFGISKKNIKEIKTEFPANKFQKETYKKVFKHAWLNLRNPFPMLKFKS